MRWFRTAVLAAPLLLLMILISGTASSQPFPPRAYLPFVSTPSMQEFRGLWVTRFDWTDGVNPASKAKIDEIVANASNAGFNAIFFQVRGVADAYYQPGPEPWSKRVSGIALGVAPSPYWDPLAYFVSKAHARGLQLHAYMNVYPVWDDCANPPPAGTTPGHFYYKLKHWYGVDKYGDMEGLQWDRYWEVSCSHYIRATPASVLADGHYLEVADYLLSNYSLDGLHLDHIRYAFRDTSCDPVSRSISGVYCFKGIPEGSTSYEAWQRQQVNGTVWQFYQMLREKHPGKWLTAAVWPIYIDKWGWSSSQGYHDYYQDSQAWVKGSYIDAIAPMIYGSTTTCPGFFTDDRWRKLASDFQSNRGSRYVIPGIGARGCGFQEIANRIEYSRQLGTAGHAIFSYSGLLNNSYFDDLRAGPYRMKARVPDLPWSASR